MSSSDLVEVGYITRLHGFRGAFVVQCGSGQDSVLSSVDSLGISSPTGEIQFHKIIEAAWMPKGWKVQVEGLDSETVVKPLLSSKIYVHRKDFPEVQENEFYLADLVGSEVWEGELRLGHLDRIESNAAKQEFWIVKEGEAEWYLPNKKAFIQKVDLKAHRIEVRDAQQFKVIS